VKLVEDVIRRVFFLPRPPSSEAREEVRAASERLARAAQKLQRGYQEGGVYKDLQDVVKLIDGRRGKNGAGKPS
jgi:hypothetical protein